jgi:hypothetical protein
MPSHKSSFLEEKCKNNFVLDFLFIYIYKVYLWSDYSTITKSRDIQSQKSMKHLASLVLSHENGVCEGKSGKYFVVTDFATWVCNMGMQLVMER